VVRFANPEGGAVSWDDLVKGPITIGNVEIDDLIILRTDRVPTYNFAVVVDDWDMAITHVFRGEDHVNNTPWQINLYEALGAPLPRFGHLPLILDETGRKMSKRRSAVSVTTYKDGGYLPEAMLNYLARLGWSHGDDELFTPQQMVQWFDGTHLARAAAMWDKAKLLWVNAHHVKHASDARLAPLVREHLARKNIATADEDLLARAAALFKDRCSTVAELAEWCEMLFAPVEPKAEELTTHLTEPVRAALPMLVRELDAVPTWDKAGIAAAMKAALAATGLKMGQLAPAVRVLVCGRSQTPSIDAVLALFSRDTVRARLMAA
jgi:glutamyl-tRNA synthetase